MARFIVRHQHDAKRCPAADPQAGATLLNYLSRSNVGQHGIEIHGEAVARGEHTLYMIVESEDQDHVRDWDRGLLRSARPPSIMPSLNFYEAMHQRQSSANGLTVNRGKST